MREVCSAVWVGCFTANPPEVAFDLLCRLMRYGAASGEKRVVADFHIFWSSSEIYNEARGNKSGTYRARRKTWK